MENDVVNKLFITGEPIKTPQHYPDVTLHPVAPGTSAQNPPVPQQGSGSLLHGILTKSQSPRAANFSPTLARLLTAPERERNPPINVSAAQQSAINQQLQAYQGNNPVSISELLSSSKVLELTKPFKCLIIVYWVFVVKYNVFVFFAGEN